MPFSWNEIRHRAIAFSNAWAGVKSEQAEKQTFWNEFFEVFGIRRRVVASFEEPVKKISGQYGYIDLFWPATVLVEHKSRGADLGKAGSQAFRYIQDLARDGRMDGIPRYVIVSDFARIALHDLEPDDQRVLPLFDTGRVQSVEFPLSELHKNIHLLAFMAGYKQHRLEEHDPINIQAVGIMGKLHDTLEAGGYSGHKLERFLVRVLFCLFAQDTGIFDPRSFADYLENRTAKDGSDLGIHLARLFDVLNTPQEKRQRNLDETLAAFPYVNGELFAESLGFADFNSDMRNALLACTRFDWSRISPAIFGSLFQSVMEPKERRQIGGHYTSERDILKVIRALFLDDLRVEFERTKGSKTELKRLHERIAALKFLDPACGCGNFLVIAYRELRLLEIEILKALYSGSTQPVLDIQRLSLVDVDAFYGIEISEWPVRIAEVAMWLMDHQMNIRLSEAFGQYFVRLPLKKSPTIVCDNALRIDWRAVLSPERCSYILGNPPFVGHHYQTSDQKADQQLVMRDIAARGVLDYVSNWYVKAAEYIAGTACAVAFVSTNSICQGEQAGILWTELFGRYSLSINFAYQTFPWESEARGKAHVHVVIVGFARTATGFQGTKYVYEITAGGFVRTAVGNISPYLVPGPDRAFLPIRKPICAVPQMFWGNKPTDGGNLILTEEEKEELIQNEPESAKFIRKFVSGGDFIDGNVRYCLWLVDATPAQLRRLPQVRRRIENVVKFRLASKAPSTRKYANMAALFRQISQPSSTYLAVPEVSSEARAYIPMAMLAPSIICSNTIQFIPNATLYHFGVLTSTMHMAWVRQVCGRLKSDYRYSNSLVYNNFSWPEAPTEKQLSAVETAAQAVLDARAEFPSASLADLYDPLAMPPALVNAHAKLDRAVDLCYRPQPFQNDRQRVEYLFALYEKLVAPLIPSARKKASKRKAAFDTK